MWNQISGAPRHRRDVVSVGGAATRAVPARDAQGRGITGPVARPGRRNECAGLLYLARLRFADAPRQDGDVLSGGDTLCGNQISSRRSPLHAIDASISQAILWVKGKHNFDWQFAVPTASVVFSLNRAWPCFCLLQAADVLHGTLHTPGRAHDGVGLAAVSRDLLSSAKARAEVARR